jgi:hypothetical protein
MWHKLKCIAVLLVAMASAVTHAKPAFSLDWYWAGGSTGDWNDEDNWPLRTIPNGEEYDVFIDSGVNGNGVIVSIDQGSPLMNTLTIGEHDSVIVHNRQPTVLSGITNNGTLEIMSPGNTTILKVGVAVTVSGNGRIRMGDSSLNYLYSIYGGTAVLTNDSNHTIEGAGNLGWGNLGLINKGLIDANLTTPLIVNPNTQGVVNQGVMRASNGGTLRFEGGNTFTNDGGVFRATTGSFVQLFNAKVVNGVFETDGTGTFQVPNAGHPTLSGLTTNNATIEVNSTGGTTILKVDAAATVSGNGRIRMGDNSLNYLYSDYGGTAVLTNDSNHTIEGAGNLGWGKLGLINKGLIDANLTTPLIVNPNTQGVVNQGVMQASNGGTLRFEGGNTFTNDGGVFRATTGSFVQLFNAKVVNGVFETDDTGAFQVPNAGHPTLSGLTTNNATIEVNSTGGTTILKVDAAATISGNGRIRMGDSSLNYLYSDHGGTAVLTNDSNHTIEGAGNLGWGNLGLINKGLIDANLTTPLIVTPNTLGVVNQGVMRASNGGTLQLQDGTFDNQGTILACNGSAVDFSSSATVPNINALSVLGSGSWKAVDGGNGASISIAAAAKTVSTIGSGASVTLSGPNSSFAIKGSAIESTLVANQGALSLLDGRTFSTAASLSNDGVVTLGQAACLNLAAGSYQQSATGVTQGIGTLLAAGGFTDSGTTRPGLSPGILTIEGNYDQLTSGVLEFEVFGIGAPGVDYDRLIIQGDAALAGTIEVTFDGFSPALGDSWTLLSASGILTADSPTIEVLGLSSGIQLIHTFDAGSYRIGVVAVPEPGTFVLLAMGSLATLIWWRSRRSSARIANFGPISC